MDTPQLRLDVEIYVRTIIKLVERTRFHYSSEADLQDGLALVFPNAKREYSLTPTDRIDFLADGVGIEVKTHGANTDILRQLHRYAQSEEIDALILLTTISRHKVGLPAEMNGKPVFCAIIRSGF